MKLEVLRFSPTKKSTYGMLFDSTYYACKSYNIPTSISSKDREPKFLCYILEDPYQPKKVYGNTCIADGTYKIKLRTEGRLHERYSKKFHEFHDGMLWIKDVPDFTDIYLHIGNSPKDTHGCPLVGDSARSNVGDTHFIYRSTRAYKRIYPRICEKLALGEEVTITFSHPLFAVRDGSLLYPYLKAHFEETFKRS